MPITDDLIKRVGRVEEPSRALDIEIYVAAYGLSRGLERWCLPYTRSLDAAASLIPQGHDWILEHTNGGMTIGARVGHNDPDKNSWGGTPALALCAAALRARQQLEKVK